ncbi:hypothetical protein V1T76_19085 [Roseibium sp. FZY0029]|uniref:hypothetical protein n=1 Tax=Roseibium sp. FZY0029 TaxID=3116647 RepID=UPI002ECD5684|nr:hypothetical protein [Roseibium sp. FZY0029]
MLNGDICIVGTVRNGGEGFKRTLSRLLRLDASSGVSQVIITTNDNQDETDQLLEEAANQSDVFQIVRLDGLVNAYKNRVERIAVARNFALEKIVLSESTSEYTIVMDLDGVNDEFDIVKVRKIIDKSSLHWDAVTANQAEAYYDLYALRHPTWCPDDCWRELRNAKRRRFFKKKNIRLLRDEYIHNRQFKIPEDHSWIEVESAFGGLAMYKTASLKGCWYSPRDSLGNLTCEHVVLHKQMIEKGGKIFIAPDLINKAPSEHLGPASGRKFDLSKI